MDRAPAESVDSRGAARDAPRGDVSRTRACWCSATSRGRFRRRAGTTLSPSREEGVVRTTVQVRRAIHGVAAIVGLIFAVACGSGGGPNEERWEVVQDYLDRQAAWGERAGDIQSVLMASGSLEEGLRSAEEQHGALPDATAAVDAAHAILAAGGPRTIEAAEFLLERSRSPLAWSPSRRGRPSSPPQRGRSDAGRPATPLGDRPVLPGRAVRLVRASPGGVAGRRRGPPV